jgi:hypothetical protein
MDSGTDVYDMERKKLLSIKFTEFTYWLAALSIIAFLLFAISCWLRRLGFVCLFVSLFVCYLAYLALWLSICLSIGRTI